MKAEAVLLDNKLIALEKDLNEAFASRKITPSQLKSKLKTIADVRMQLRYVHLITHLQTPLMLTAAQVEQYNRLRGYGSGDPCTNIPKGHDPDMWKKHNSCK